jgi:hypothetical protein
MESFGAVHTAAKRVQGLDTGANAVATTINEQDREFAQIAGNLKNTHTRSKAELQR